MQYTQPSFTVSVSNPKVSQKTWDRAFLSDVEFVAKYGKEAVDGLVPEPVSGGRLGA